jgi:hypothetical protein
MIRVSIKQIFGLDKPQTNQSAEQAKVENEEAISFLKELIFITYMKSFNKL